MGIEALISRRATETAVYWGNPVNDGAGTFTFDAPVEIDCRWEEMKQIVSDKKGNSLSSRALVYLTQDVDEEGYMFLGTLEQVYDLTGESSGGGSDDPTEVTGAFIIKRFQKIPSLDGSNYVRVAYLTPSLSFGGF